MILSRESLGIDLQKRTFAPLLANFPKWKSIGVRIDAYEYPEEFAIQAMIRVSPSDYFPHTFSQAATSG